MAVAEGIETGLSVLAGLRKFGIGVWVAGPLSNMAGAGVVRWRERESKAHEGGREGARRGAGHHDGGTKVGEISQTGTIVPWCSVKAPPVAG
ncbi:MAG: hypothetical protein CMF63_02050 [Magnetovibrio sp.]|nr:hypothetical protein [Magnetovibrio sp.]